MECLAGRRVPQDTAEDGPGHGAPRRHTRREAWQGLEIREEYIVRVVYNPDARKSEAMPLTKSPNSPYWQIRFEIAGIEVRRSSRTRDKLAAQELEKQLQDELWRQVKLGEQHYWEGFHHTRAI